MPRIPLTAGAYSSRSLIASAQRCVNLFPEVTPEASTPPTPVVHLLTPGLDLFTAGPANKPVAALHRCANGLRIAIMGGSVYWINILTGVATLMGFATAPASYQVSICDNGITAVIVDGTGSGWWFKIATSGFGVPIDPTIHVFADAAFYGGARACFLDGFFIFNRPGTNQFYLSPPFWDGTTPFDGTYIASKTGGPDPILTIAVINGNLWLVGQLTTEVWYNAGGADFPLARQPGVFVEHGCAAPYSIASTDVEIICLSRDEAGGGVVLKSEGYGFKRVSNHALENLLLGQTYSDAIGSIYQMEGHTFYVLSLPTMGQTWALDLATGEWHERTSTTGGAEGRHRLNCTVFWDDGVYVGDYANGNIYRFNNATLTDNGAQIVRRRGFPHIVKDGKRLSYNSFIADMDVSQVGAGSTVSLRWSDDRGATWKTPVPLTIADTYSSLIVRRLGLARDRVFELSWTFAYQTSLQGAWIEAEKAET